MNEVSPTHPSRYIAGALAALEDAFHKFRVGGLRIWTNVIRKHQQRQNAVSVELIREAREAQTLFEAIIADGVVTDCERDQLLRLLREMETELLEGRVIEGSGR